MRKPRREDRSTHMAKAAKAGDVNGVLKALADSPMPGGEIAEAMTAVIRARIYTPK